MPSLVHFYKILLPYKAKDQMSQMASEPELLSSHSLHCHRPAGTLIPLHLFSTSLEYGQYLNSLGKWNG